MAKSNLAEGVDPGFQFKEVRQTLLQEQYKDRLNKPLQYWVLPSDRRLPLALLGRTIGELLSTPFDDLSATPGIGYKKICSLVQLLDRATRDEPPSVSLGNHTPTPTVDDTGEAEASADVTFDPGIVSEALWAEWRETVRRLSIEDQKLGRLAPSLQRLPTVIWHTPLRDYLDYTVAEIRALRTHGEKRVRCVLEVFHSVYRRVTSAQPTDDLAKLLTPAWIKSLAAWAERRRHSLEMPTDEDVAAGFVQPLLDLIETDCGPTVSSLVRQRLGVGCAARSVREQARSLEVTRARVYQLLDDCAKVMAVRWPEGRTELDRLAQHFSTIEADHSPLRLFFGLRELCFPEKHADDGSVPLRASQHPGVSSDSDASATRVDPRANPANARSGEADEVPNRGNQQGTKVTRTDGPETHSGKWHITGHR